MGFEYLLIGKAGSKSNIIFGDVLTALKYTTPRYIVWCMGMNDNSDVDENTPDATWLAYLHKLIDVCDDRGITPILTTIPNVPDISHVGKNKWVRESGYRYIDFCAAVGATDEGVWYTGCLDSDEVHPTVIGAKALLAGALKDFSELMQY